MPSPLAGSRQTYQFPSMTDDRDSTSDSAVVETEPPAAAETRREPIFNLPVAVTALIAVCVGIHIIRSTLLDPDQDFWLIVHFAFIPIRYSGDYLIDVYAYLGPATYAFLHGGLAHLAVNMVWLAAFGSPLANRIGPARFLLFWLVASLAAVGLHYALHPVDATPLVGASGAISGMMGAAARFGFRIERIDGRAAFGGRILSVPAVFRSRGAVTFLAVWMGVNLLMAFGFGAPGVAGRIAWEAHIGGFLAGFLLVRLFDPARPQDVDRSQST